MINPQDYTDGVQQSPGKFEGEPAATRYYWELVMNGEGEDCYPRTLASGEGIEYDMVDEKPYTFFTVDGDEDTAFSQHDIHCGDTVVLFEDDQGFVSLCGFKSRNAADSWMHKHAGTN